MSALPAELQRELADLLGERNWLTDPGERLAYAYDNSRRESLPDAVALPVARGQVQALLRACYRHRVPVVARGRGTNTTGAAVPRAVRQITSFAGSVARNTPTTSAVITVGVA